MKYILSLSDDVGDLDSDEETVEWELAFDTAFSDFDPNHVNASEAIVNRVFAKCAECGDVLEVLK